MEFRGQESLLTLVMPDIHARPDFIFNTLKFVLPKRASGLKEAVRVADALEQNMLRLVLVGDLLHGEARAYERWMLAYEMFLAGKEDSSFMKAEMREGLSALMAVMECKCRWPKNFHCLKGNHENITNEQDGGDFPFRKFAAEGSMVRGFMKAHYGARVLNAVRDFEKSLPLAFCTDNLLVSHAEPRFAFSRKDVICAPHDPEVVYGLTWTANEAAADGSVAAMLDEFCGGKSGAESGDEKNARANGTEARYIGGHRQVKGKYFERQGGLYIQIHNPNEQNVAVVRTDRTFVPKTDILGVEK